MNFRTIILLGYAFFELELTLLRLLQSKLVLCEPVQPAAVCGTRAAGGPHLSSVPAFWLAGDSDLLLFLVAP